MMIIVQKESKWGNLYLIEDWIYLVLELGVLLMIILQLEVCDQWRRQKFFNGGAPIRDTN